MEAVEFRPESSPPRLTVADRVQPRQYSLQLPETPQTVALDPGEMAYPVDRAVTLETDGVDIPNIYSLVVRRPGGEMVDVVSRNGRFEGTDREYIIEVCAPVKTYLRVEAPVRITADDEEVALEFPTTTELAVGARAVLERPTAEITTTGEPQSIARAVEATGGALQTTSPERSFPTLRGHPPRIRLGERLDIPDLASPQTGVTVEVRPRLADIYALAPAVYYLGANVRVGDAPRVVTDEGFEYDLDADDIGAAARRLLQQNFLLDCLARVHGYYSLDSAEYDALAGDLPVDFAAAYDAPPAERFERYMAVPFADLSPALPQWPVAACVEPDPERVSALPYVVNELGLVYPVSPERYTGERARRAALDAFVAAEPTRTRAASAVYDGEAAFVDVPGTGATDQLWVGEDVPLHANKFLADGHRHRHERDPERPDAIRVRLVCNDAGMVREARTGRGIYASEGAVPFDLDVSVGLGTEELADALAADAEFFHFVGHATGAGLECHDGHLDVEGLDAVGPEAFLLNACQSYRQGLSLVAGGSIGGIVTLSEIGDDAAGEVGLTLARLLNQGFSLRAALDIARTRSVVGGQYLVVGDDSTAIAGNESIVPYWCVIEEADADGTVELTVPTSLGIEGWGLGTLHHLQVEDGVRFLAGRTRGPFTLTAAELREFLALQDAPVRYDGGLYFGEEVMGELPD